MTESELQRNELANITEVASAGNLPTTLEDDNMGDDEDSFDVGIPADDEDDLASEDDPEAEADLPLASKSTTIEPSYEKANQFKFFDLCYRMEQIWLLKVNKKLRKKAPTDAEKLQVLLPPKFLAYLADYDNSGSDSSAPGPSTSTSSTRPESIFPIFRLLMPDKDSTRQWKIKERSLAEMYAGALGLAKGQADFEKLFHFADPNCVSVQEGVGDLPRVLASVIAQRVIHDATGKTGSDWTVGEINAMLDDLGALSNMSRGTSGGHQDEPKITEPSQHDWRSSADKAGHAAATKSRKEKRIEWVKRLNPPATARHKGLSPLEHLWLARILLGGVQLGVGWKRMMDWYHRDASALWSAHNSLKGICTILCQPGFRLRSKQSDRGSQQDEYSTTSYMPRSMAALELGIPFLPMRSERTGFARLFDDLSHRHREFTKTLLKEGSRAGPNAMAASRSLAFRHPAFAVETKLDGERILVHFSRDGVVQMHTRRGNWYSPVYSPVLGPALRRALGEHKLDLILDGEVLAWDAGRQETVPFGNNRTVANLRRSYMEQKGLLEAKDTKLHDGDSRFRVMTSSWNDKNDQPWKLAGEECWLEFVAFDILYIDGPGAADLISTTVSPTTSPKPGPGAIIDLDGFERKKLLYRLVEPQDHEVAIVPTTIVRPNGKTEKGSDYFDALHPTQECGYPMYLLDSISCVLSGAIDQLAQIDLDRRADMSDAQIAEVRAQSVDRLYKATVEDQRMEGLIFKDLSAPYFLGDESKSLRYWLKFKPDYFNGSVASDLDVVILGSYFASGLRMSGRPSAFLCGCVDAEERELYLTLCKVNAGSIDTEAYNKIIGSTGFSDSDSGPERRGAWFRLEHHGSALPDFISHRSMQSKNEDNGWRFDRKDYPDYWIRPEDSKILTLNAGEIVCSDAFSAGLTLRFPRISKVRDEGDDKSPWEIESDVSLLKLYREVIASRSGVVLEPTQVGSPGKTLTKQTRRFLTEEEQAETKKKQRRPGKAKARLGIEAIPEIQTTKSRALSGMTFTVLDGTYKLEKGGIDENEASDGGWLREVSAVRSSFDVKLYIMEHGGKVVMEPDPETLVLGGRHTDSRVAAHIRGIENSINWTELSSPNAKSQKMVRIAKMASSPGVLRWTFVFSLVHRWISRHNVGEVLSIKETDPRLTIASILDYLAFPQKGGADSDILVRLCREELSTFYRMKRALGLIQNISATGSGISKRRRVLEASATSRWQFEVQQSLPAQWRWIVKTSFDVFWPYDTVDCKDNEHMAIFYPDIFGADLGLLYHTDVETQQSADSADSRWTAAPSDNAIAASLPLARAMGAILTSHLHRDVSHVICELEDGVDELTFSGSCDVARFTESSHGRKLVERLQEIVKLSGHAIKLVTARWIRSKWNDTVVTS